MCAHLAYVREAFAESAEIQHQRHDWQWYPRAPVSYHSCFEYFTPICWKPAKEFSPSVCGSKVSLQYPSGILNFPCPGCFLESRCATKNVAVGVNVPLSFQTRSSVSIMSMMDVSPGQLNLWFKKSQWWSACFAYAKAFCSTNVRAFMTKKTFISDFCFDT